MDQNLKMVFAAIKKVCYPTSAEQNDKDDLTNVAEFLQRSLCSQLDQTCEENDSDNGFTMEKLKKWLQTECKIPDDKLDQCAKSIMEATYEGENTIDPYDLGGKLLDIALQEQDKEQEVENS